MKAKNLWLIWLLLFGFYIYMAAVVMSGTSARIMESADNPDCTKIPDLFMFGIAADDLKSSFDCMGTAGRAAYRKAETNSDSIYPLAYGLFLAYSLWFLVVFIFKNRKIAAVVALIPILAMCFDYLENHHLLKLLDSYPHFDDGVVASASLFNTLKWALALPSMLAVVVFAIIALVLKFRKSSYNLS